MNLGLESRVDMSMQLATSPELGSLQKAPVNSPEAMKAVAEEFESLFMNMMMKSMRSANRTLSEGNYFNSFESKMYEDMLDEKLSVSLSKNGGLGIADLLMRQFSKGPDVSGYQLEMGASENPLFPPERRAAFDNRDQFVQELLPRAEQAARSLDTKAEFIVSQAALETGWGQHLMFTGDGKNSHNLFGIKANSEWRGATVNIESIEVESGVAAKVSSQFKVYPDYNSAFRDYAALLKGNERYAGVPGAQTIESFTEGLASGGYATDPQYGQKVSRVLDDLTDTHLTLRSD